jgi:hypothetical protein
VNVYIVETVIKRENFTDAQQAVLHNNGPETEIGYRLAWARTYLKGMGLLDNSARGVWTLKDGGTALVTDPSAADDQRRERVRELGRRIWLSCGRRGKPGSCGRMRSLIGRSRMRSLAGRSSCSAS